MSTMSQPVGKIMIAVAAGSCGLLALAYPDWRSEVRAQGYADVVIPLFEATPTFATGPNRSPGLAESFASTSVDIVDFDPNRQRAVIASRADGGGGIVIDNFLAINDQNVCERVVGTQFPESCFDEIVDPFRPAGVDIRTVLAPIPAIDVTRFIPPGTNTVEFTLFDFGDIAGNSDLFLAITTLPEITPPPDCRAQAFRVFNEAFERCDEEFRTCLDAGSCEIALQFCLSRASAELDIALQLCGP